MTTLTARRLFALYNSGHYVSTCRCCGAPCGVLATGYTPLKPRYYQHIGRLVANPDNDVVSAPIWRDLDLDHEAVPS